jgi:hypothetical protein
MYPQALKAIQVATVKAIQQRIEVRRDTDGEGMCAEALMHNRCPGPSSQGWDGPMTVMVVYV